MTPEPAPAQPVFDRIGYRGIEREPVGWGHAVWAICRWNLRLLFRRPIFWGLIGLGMIGFLTHFALIYIKAELAIQNRELARFMDQFRVTGNGEAYRDFIRMQAWSAMVTLAYAGALVVMSDYRAGGVAFYLSKPIAKRDYILGKLLTLSIVLGLLTMVPGLLLFLEYGFFSQSLQYFADNWLIARGIVGYSLVLMLVPPLVLLAVAALLRRTAPVLLVWCAVFLLLPTVGEVLWGVFKNRAWRLLSLWQDLRIVGDQCFGSVRFRSEEPYVGWAIVVVLGLVAFSVIVLERRLNAVEAVQ